MDEAPRPTEPRVLVVEDDPDQGHFIQLLLENEGLAAHHAPNGAAALAALQDGTFEAVVSDIQMPLLDGYQLCRLIKDAPSLAGVPVILLTSFQEPGRRFWARICGADLFLPKQAIPTELGRRVRELLQNPPTPGLRNPSVEIRRGDLNLDRVHHLLGQALENRLRENALRGAVTDLSRHYQDPDRLVEDFLRLVQDLVGGGLAYLFCPGQVEHRLHLLGSRHHLDVLGPELAARFCQGEVPLQVAAALAETDELAPPFATLELELPLWGHSLSSPACWGCLAPQANLDRAGAELRIITEEFKPLFAGSQTLVHLGLSNAQLLEADLRKTRLLDTLSHELRAPITAIRLREDLILEGAETLPPEAHRLLKANQHIFERLHRMLNGFLQLERIQQGAVRLELEPLDLCAFLQDQLDDLQMLCAPKGLQLTLDAPAPCVIWADGDRVVQCLINLVTNAIAHSPEGGRIRVALMENGTHGCIRVQDEGPGVPEAFQASLFQPFQQQVRARPDSVGLGLAITQALVQAMGGRIRYLRLPGEGACFQLEFTLQAAPPPEEDPMLG